MNEERDALRAKAERDDQARWERAVKKHGNVHAIPNDVVHELNAAAAADYRKAWGRDPVWAEKTRDRINAESAEAHAEKRRMKEEGIADPAALDEPRTTRGGRRTK